MPKRTQLHVNRLIYHRYLSLKQYEDHATSLQIKQFSMSSLLINLSPSLSFLHKAKLLFFAK